MLEMRHMERMYTVLHSIKDSIVLPTIVSFFTVNFTIHSISFHFIVM